MKTSKETKYLGIVILYSLKREAKYRKRGKPLLQIPQMAGSEEVNKQHFNQKCQGMYSSACKGVRPLVPCITVKDYC